MKYRALKTKITYMEKATGNSTRENESILTRLLTDVVVGLTGEQRGSATKQELIGIASQGFTRSGAKDLPTAMKIAEQKHVCGGLVQSIKRALVTK